MDYTKEYAIALGEKVLRDVGYWGDDVEDPSVKYFETSPTLVIPNKSWLVSFPYGAEDFGTDEKGKAYASMMVTIFDDYGMATSISYRNGYVKLGYNQEEDKYFIAERRP